MVGDSILDDRGTGLVAAASEAVVNAVKHSQAEQVSVYLEVSEGKAEVWVTDQGVGFDRGQVPGDRKGVVESIERRMTRLGGTAQINTALGEGTEVHLVLPNVEARAR